MRNRVVAAAIGLAVLALAAFLVQVIGAEGDAGTQTRPPAETLLGRWPLSQFRIEHDRFLAATDPRTIPAAEVDFLRPESEVFGVVLKGEARAYPITMIAYHHVVNDVIQGIPVAVTY